MALGIYYAPNENSKYKDIYPFAVTFDGRVGGAQDWLVYVRNDDNTRYYTGISITAVATSGENIVDNSKPGYRWRFMEKDIAPSDVEWNSVAYGNTLSLSSDIGSVHEGDTVTYLPVWVRVEAPENQLIRSFTNVVLRLSAQANLVST